MSNKPYIEAVSVSKIEEGDMLRVITETSDTMGMVVKVTSDCIITKDITSGHETKILIYKQANKP